MTVQEFIAPITFANDRAGWLPELLPFEDEA